MKSLRPGCERILACLHIGTDAKAPSFSMSCCSRIGGQTRRTSPTWAIAMTETALIDAIVVPFIESTNRNGFNGVPALKLLVLQPDQGELRARLSSLISKGLIVAVFASQAVNMHIKRFPDMSIEEQLSGLESEPLDGICLYPCAVVVREHVDISEWHDRPFSKLLLLGEAQLSFRAFDMAALERYVSDPRYDVVFEDYMGRMSVTNASFSDVAYPERDKVGIQSFGLGFDSKRHPCVIVYLRYLSMLSAEHQQYWHSYVIKEGGRMCEPYFVSSIEGDFWKSHSVREAIIEEVTLLRLLSEAIWGKSLFRALPERRVPIGLTAFLRPTVENFNRFVMALDKLLSECIDVKFFEGRLCLETETQRNDGKIIVQSKGTLKLLEEWLLQEIIWEDTNAFQDIIIKPLRNVRRLRQVPAHTFIDDNFSLDYYQRRKDILCGILNSLSNIRATLSRHPRAKHIDIPKWLDGPVDVF